MRGECFISQKSPNKKIKLPVTCVVSEYCALLFFFKATLSDPLKKKKKQVQQGNMKTKREGVTVVVS